MKQTIAEVVFPIKAVVGEGSLWDYENNRLLWVDILDHKIYAFNLENGSNIGYNLGQDVGTVVLTESGLWAYADQDGIGFINPNTGETVFEVIIPGAPKVTSCASGGDNLDELYVTTTCYLMNDEAFEEYPNSGSLFKANVPFKGILPYKIKN